MADSRIHDLSTTATTLSSGDYVVLDNDSDSDAKKFAATSLARGDGIYNVLNYGATGDGTTDDSAAFDSALAAAGTGIVYVPDGTYNVDAGISLSGHSAVIIGQSTKGTVIKAASPSGYVLDFTGWTGTPTNNFGNMEFANFTVQGDNTSDATLANGGIKIKDVQNITFRNIGVKETGGPALYIENSWGFLFENCVFGRPAAADTNDVPYVHIYGYCNASTFMNCGLRSTVSTADGSAVVKIEDDGTYCTDGVNFNNCWGELLDTPENGAVFDCEMYNSRISMFNNYDSGTSTTSTTNTAVIRLKDSAVTNFGGNLITGVIPGRGSASDSYAYGVDIRQDGNAVIGVQGFQSHNVVLASGVNNCSIIFTGRVSSATSTNAIVDNSSSAANSYLNLTHGEFALQGVEITGNAVGAFPDLIIANRTNSTPRQVWIKIGDTNGPYIRGVNGQDYMQIGSDELYIKNKADSAFTTIRIGGVDFREAMSDSAKDPTSDAPDDWVEVKIAGTTYYVPVYAAS